MKTLTGDTIIPEYILSPNFHVTVLDGEQNYHRVTMYIGIVWTHRTKTSLKILTYIIHPHIAHMASSRCAIFETFFLQEEEEHTRSPNYLYEFLIPYCE